LFHARESEGKYFLVVVIGNFICGIIYLCAVYGFFKEKNWTTNILFIAAFILLFTFVILVIYIFTGSVYEEKTILNILIRTFITLVFTLISWNYITKKKQFSEY
jgi:ABC-type transport system involved in multi-copper enzyme maturation permease subunit